MKGHVDEVLDIAFNSTGTRLVTASADGTARVYNVHNGACMSLLTGLLIISFFENPLLFAQTQQHKIIYFSKYLIYFFPINSLKGHDGEISKVSFNPQGTKIITAGLDCTARIWATETGE